MRGVSEHLSEHITTHHPPSRAEVTAQTEVKEEQVDEDASDTHHGQTVELEIDDDSLHALAIQKLFRGFKRRMILRTWGLILHEMKQMFRLRQKNVRTRNQLALLKAQDSVDSAELKKHYKKVQHDILDTLTRLNREDAVVLEKGKQEFVHITLQGNKEHYTESALYRRRMLQREERLRALSLIFWKVAKAASSRQGKKKARRDRDASIYDDTMTWPEYKTLFLRISKVLVPDYNALECEVTVQADWDFENKTREVKHPVTGQIMPAICQEQVT